MNRTIETLLDGREEMDFHHGKADYYQYISRLLKGIHEAIPAEHFNTDRMPAPVDYRTEHFDGTEHGRAVMYLMSNGCQWALKSGNGCTMCGHLAKQTRRQEKISAREYCRQFSAEFQTIDFSRYPLLNLYNNGSFFNEDEMPGEARREILGMINREPAIKMLVLESRPEFITPGRVEEIRRAVPDKHVEIAMGLEMKNDFLRRLCINKGFNLGQYERAAAAVTAHLALRTYVLLKPPFLTEKEALDSAVETIRHAFECGSSTVSLEACTIQDYTLVRHMADRGLYHTPWLWSILEAVKQNAGSGKLVGKLVVGLFQFFPSPREVPYNCPKCSDTVMAALKRYNRTLDIGELNALDALSCDCRARWRAEMETNHPPLAQRLQNTIEKLKSNLIPN